MSDKDLLSRENIIVLKISGMWLLKNTFNAFNQYLAMNWSFKFKARFNGNKTQVRSHLNASE